MRPEAPAKFTPSIIERLGLFRFASATFRMALRNLHRRPWQAAFTMLGLALATAIPIVPGAMREGIDYILDFQWSLAARQDATVSLIEPGSASALNDVLHLPGVMNAEPFRSVPARLRFGHHSRRLGVTGLPRGATLNRLLDANARPVELPRQTGRHGDHRSAGGATAGDRRGDPRHDRGLRWGGCLHGDWRATAHPARRRHAQRRAPCGGPEAVE
jgi:hypothetical protein